MTRKMEFTRKEFEKGKWSSDDSRPARWHDSLILKMFW
jgi:hypothetical protein